MDFFKPLTSICCFGAASLLTIVSLRWRRRNRLRSIAPICLLSFLSLASAHQLSWPLGLDTTLASVVVFYLPYSIKLLAFDEHAMNPELSTYDWRLVDCYRTWNNPRMLPLRLSPFERTEPCDWKSRARFMLHQAIKAAALWAFHYFVFQKLLTRALSNIVAADFSPAMELPPFDKTFLLSLHQLRVRVFMSFQWIWIAFFFLEFYHSLMAMVFVSILGFDQPEDWPPLFGNPLEASSLRGFWGRFWHRLTIPTFHHYSVLISRKLLRLRPGSRSEKTVIPWLIFTMSGLSHCLVGWALNDAAPSRDVLFFELNFIAAAVETMVSKAQLSGTSMKRFTQASWLLSKSADFAWVALFFFCTAPMWTYPKVYPALKGVLG